MVVIAIIGTLAAIGIPVYSSWIEKAKITKAISEIRIIEKEITAYYIENNELPQSLADISKEGLMDPWGNPYEYLNLQATKGKGKMRKDRFMVPINTDFDLYSKGPDGRSVSPLTAKHSHDDIIRANDGEFVGSASQY